MANDIRVQKTVLNKEEFTKAVDSSFKTFILPAEEVNTDTRAELFRLYEKLYYSIPTEGEKSHTYLIQQSSKLVSIEKDLTEIQPLLDEISDLRQQILELNQNLIEAQSEALTDGAI